ncbi:type IV pilin protein [Candidatus Avelusimicrobium caledoniensis]|uniref:type IV pilin protein n=1 Tax=Candidatus Avelusimicrobium caledoniensis TaxID=3416220 RepID=UPI003D0ED92B
MKQGFTLIELLVVVLIIGILSSVALPQYTKAVEKARASEAIQLLGDLATAEQIYQMGMGSYTNDLTMLDLQLPGLCGTSSAYTKNFKVSVVSHSPSFTAKAERIDSNKTPFTGTAELHYTLGLNIDTNGNITRWCDTDVAAGKTSGFTTTNKVCKSVANNSTGEIK